MQTKQRTIMAEIDDIFVPNFTYNDAGRSKTKWSGTNDCGIRAFTLATGTHYNQSRKILKAFNHIGIAKHRRVSNGIFREDMDLAMESHGWFYTKCPSDTYYYEIDGIALLDMPRHFSFIADGILYDTWDCSMRRVVGYWQEIAE